MCLLSFRRHFSSVVKATPVQKVYDVDCVNPTTQVPQLGLKKEMPLIWTSEQ